MKHGKTQISVEERQLIFKLRAQMTNVKMNFRGMHENFQCEICWKENESQQHIMEYRKWNENINDKIDYTKIENGNLNEMVAIARKFKRNIEIRDMGINEIRWRMLYMYYISNDNTLKMVPGDRTLYSLSL